jgi:hypothetical protein
MVMDPGLQAEQFLAAEIAGLTGEVPEHEPAAAQLPNGGVADFRMRADRLGYPDRFLLVEVKSLHDVTAVTRHWLVDFAINHPDIPSSWPARTEWTSAGERRLREVDVTAAELTSPDALKKLTSNNRLKALAERGGHLYQLAATANQFAVMILFGSEAITNPALRWPAKAVNGSFPGVVPKSLEPKPVAFFAGETGRPSVARDIRASLEKKFSGYVGPDACLAVVVSDADRENTWAALLDGQLGYPIDGSAPTFQVNQDFYVPGLLVAAYTPEPPNEPRWSYRSTTSIDTAECFEDICLVALDSPTRPGGAP